MANILVIDDDGGIRETVSRILRSRGHAVAIAGEGGAGVLHVWEHAPDLVITDIFMPGLDGFRTLRELRAAFPELKIIVMSGDHGTGLLNVLYDAEVLGANESIPKPFTPQELMRVVNAVLEQ